MENKGQKVSEKGLKGGSGSENMTLDETNPEKSPQDDEKDLLYTHKPENRGSSIQWNSAFCRKPGR